MGISFAAARRPALLCASAIGGIMMPVASAQAQQDQTSGQTSADTSISTTPPVQDATPAIDVVVTGTRISRSDLQVASPLTVVGQQEIQFRQANTAEELLRDLPSVRPNLGPAVNNGSDGSSSIDLRGIGSNRTLVLLDGRRVVPFGLDNVVDLNVLPISVLDRVDVFTGGASSTYGADAVAGVVNFVTKRNFSGVDGSVNYRITERGDAAQRRASLMIGANLDEDRGNVMLAVSYLKRNSLQATERDIAAFPISSATGLFTGSPTAQVTVFASPSNARLGLAASNFGAVVNPSTGLLQAATANDTYNSNIGTYFQTPLSQFSAFSSARYQISPAFEAYASALFTRNEAAIQLASSGTFSSTYQLSLNNPYLPTGVRNQLCSALTIAAATCNAAAAVRGGPGTPGYLEVPVIAQRRFTELGPRGNPVVSDVFQLQAGLRGDITSTLHYDVSGQFGETRQNQQRQNWGSFSKVQQSLRAYRAASGTLTCTDTSNGCVPLNLFGPNGSITPDQLGFINLTSLINRVVRQGVVTGNVNGDLFGVKSPFAETAVAFSIGAEYRKLTARSTPDAAAQVQGEVLGTGARTPPDFGQYDVKEVFGEIIAPLVSDKRFLYRLQLEGGIRYSDYSTTGGSTTYKAGGSIEPVQGYKFRGMYQVAVRSPNINELFQSPVTGLGNLSVDPCQASALTSAAANLGLAALCVATGAPASTIGQIPTPSSSQIDTTTSGNRNLGVERANTYTIGGVFTPSFVRRLAVTVDYYNIKVTNAITTPASGDILNGCYSAALNPGYTYNAFCQLIERNALNGSLNAGGLRGVILAGSNLGVIQTAGVEFGVTYKVVPADFGINKDIGSVSFSLNGTYLDYYHFQATPNAINRDCTAHYSTNCTNPRPGWKYNTRLTYSFGPVDLSLFWRHIGAVGLEPFLATAITPLATAQPGGPNPSTVLAQYRRIPAYNYFDLAARATIGDNLELSLTIDNLTDKSAPLVGSSVGGTAFNSGNTFPTVYDVLGRTYAMGVRLKF